MAAAAMAMNAQSAFNVSPDYYETESGEGTPLYLLGESLSSNKTYVSGEDQMMLVPFVWNVENNDVKLLIIDDNVEMPANWDDEGNVTEWETVQMTRSGSFRAVSPDGLAVGSVTDQAEYVSYPVMFDASTGKHTFLYREEGEAGGEGYAITDDSKSILGFYFDESWATKPCMWTNEGQTRTNLPTPSAEEAGFPVDYASARWMTPDAKTVLGYVQDSYSGDWITVLWNLQDDGSYTPDCTMAKTLYQPRPYHEIEGPDGWPVVVYDEIVDPKPFTQLEPLAISANGEWIVAVVADYVDEDNDQNPFMAAKNIRYNVKTGQYDVIEVTGETAKIEIFGIANNGTAAGRYTGEFDWDTWSQPTDAVIWPVGSASLIKVAELMKDDPYVDGWAASALSTISADGKTVMGYASDEMGFQTTFVFELPASIAGISSAGADTKANATYDLSGRRVGSAQNGFFIVNGKKTIR